MKSAFVVLVVLGFGACTVSCSSGYVSRGRSLYYEGRFLESAEVLALHEREFGQQPVKRQAEYATYRGLSMLVLGDYPQAHRWLATAYEIERVAPGSLRPEYRFDLDRGWGELAIRYPLPATSRPAPSRPVMR